MNPLRFLAAAALVALAFTGCVTMSVSSHLDRDVDFTAFHTWDWGKADALPTGDARLDNNQFFQDFLQGAVERSMARSGFARVTGNEKPQLLVHYHTNVNQRFQVGEPVNCAPGDCRPEVTDYEQGTLVIDVVDTATNRVVWRGWAQDSLSGIIDNQDRLEAKTDEAVRKIFAQFPGIQ
jgi:hypothetical protein